MNKKDMPLGALTIQEFYTLTKELLEGILKQDKDVAPPEKFISRMELAKMLGVSTVTLDKYDRIGLIQNRIKIGGRVNYLLSDVQRFIETHKK